MFDSLRRRTTTNAWRSGETRRLLLTIFTLTTTVPVGFAGDSVPFVRGDVNSDGAIDIADPVSLLSCQFLGGACPDCTDAGDSNDDGRLDIADAVFSLSWLFQGGEAPPAPMPVAPAYRPEDCGVDPTDDELPCVAFAPCGGIPAEGSIEGTIVATVIDGFSVETSLEPSTDLTIVAVGENSELLAEIDDGGNFAFPAMPEGTYLLSATTPGGEGTELSVDVAAGQTTLVNFNINPHLEEFVGAGFAGLVIESELDLNPDVDLSGQIDLVDLQALREAGDEEAARLALAEEYFGRVVLRVPGVYEAQVNEGGTVFHVDGGDFSGQSRGGFVRGVIEPAGSPTLLRFLVTEDSGTIELDGVGSITVGGVPKTSTEITVDLDTGRVIEGSATVRMSGPAFEIPVDVEFSIPDGFIAGAAHGFGAYQLVGVTAVLPEEFPFLGGRLLLMSKCDKPKANVNCSNPAARCPAPATRAGFPCASPGAACAAGGRCSTCTTVQRPVFRDCWCDC